MRLRHIMVFVVCGLQWLLNCLFVEWCLSSIFLGVLEKHNYHRRTSERGWLYFLYSLCFSYVKRMVANFLHEKKYFSSWRKIFLFMQINCSFHDCKSLLIISITIIYFKFSKDSLWKLIGFMLYLYKTWERLYVVVLLYINKVKVIIL